MTTEVIAATDITTTLATYSGIIAGISATIGGIATIIGIRVAWVVHKNQRLQNQRQLIIPLWEYMANLSEITSNSPTPDVIKVVNTLELVALCCEGGMVDKQVIRRTFKDQFVKHYDDVKALTSPLAGISHNGEQLLKQNKAAVEFYTSLNNEVLAQDRLNITN